MHWRKTGQTWGKIGGQQTQPMLHVEDEIWTYANNDNNDENCAVFESRRKKDSLLRWVKSGVIIIVHVWLNYTNVQ